MRKSNRIQSTVFVWKKKGKVHWVGVRMLLNPGSGMLRPETAGQKARKNGMQRFLSSVTKRGREIYFTCRIKISIRGKVHLDP